MQPSFNRVDKDNHLFTEHQPGDENEVKGFGWKISGTKSADFSKLSKDKNKSGTTNEREKSQNKNWRKMRCASKKQQSSNFSGDRYRGQKKVDKRLMEIRILNESRRCLAPGTTLTSSSELKPGTKLGWRKIFAQPRWPARPQHATWKIIVGLTWQPLYKKRASCVRGRGARSKPRRPDVQFRRSLTCVTLVDFLVGCHGRCRGFVVEGVRQSEASTTSATRRSAAQ